MQWTPGGVSEDIEDRRDESGGGGFGGGGFGFGHLGIGGVLIVGLLSLIFGRNFFTLFSGAGPTTTATYRTPNPQQDAGENTEVQFVSFVLDDVQKNWDTILPQAENRPYRHAKLVLFRNAYPSGCGTAKDAIGPFYCPEDEKVYLDLGFFDELKNRFGAPGEFAQAYVIAHEIGHHVQKILGIEPKVRMLQERNPSAANPLSVRLELQADCFAGIWAHSTQQRRITDASDVRSALGAAAAVGDDRLQRMATGRVSPESFTHGSSAQREEWFQRGLDSGRLSACNTFSAGQ
ncbi:MAG: zinc metallopeptidase [Acidobacteriaceae bacterium]|nr:zinc metallopeptidase [Acidobacteriaceae bacterium]MBV9222929.1 zinc metallopeptidase [Acidobacteriaceae bacterium]MBV9305095.1 zinc metallopeptidase [Acidobacteriaceae bacterium]